MANCPQDELSFLRNQRSARDRHRTLGALRSKEMTPTEFQAAVDRTLDELPEWVVNQLDNLTIVVDEEPPPQLGDVLGVYEGVSLPERSADYWGALPDQITIFRQPHLRMHLEGQALADEIRKTVLHEIAHHIGIDDDRLHELGWD